MRIAFLSVFHPYRGGISQFSGNLLEALGEGNDVSAFNFSRQYPSFLFPGKTPVCPGKPRYIILNTTKGKGVSFMEGQVGWHGKAPNAEQAEQALKELED